MYKSLLSGLLFVAVVFPAAALMPSSGTKTGVLDVSAPFAEQRQTIEKALADGKTYSELSAKDRNEVNSALGRISFQLESAGSAAALSEEEKTRVFNDQEIVNTLLTRASADSRLICTREKKLGSHRPITNCATVAERRRMLEQSQDALLNKPLPQLKPGG